MLLDTYRRIYTRERVCNSLSDVYGTVDIGGKYLERIDINPVLSDVYFDWFSEFLELSGCSAERKALTQVEDDRWNAALHEFSANALGSVRFARAAFSNN